jgi:hypothetical protein
MGESLASAILIVALIGISLIGLWFGTLAMSITSKINSTLGYLTSQLKNIPGLRAVSIITGLGTSKLTFGIDETCELISSCQPTSLLYDQGSRKFHPAVVTALNNWLSDPTLSPAMRQEFLNSADVKEWKKVRRIDSEAGDLMCANVHPRGRGARDSSYIRVFFLFSLLTSYSQWHSIRCLTTMEVY